MQTSQRHSSSRTHSQSNYMGTLITSNIIDSYQKSLHNYDENLNNIRKLVNEQVIENHRKIRLQFQKIREKN